MPFTGAEEIGEAVGRFFHDPFGFMVLAVLVALIWTYLTKYSIKKGGLIGIKSVWRKERSIKYFDCYQIIVAGGFSHFLLDYLFHPNTNWYEWVMSTGDWIHGESNPGPSQLPMIGTFAIGIIWIVFMMIIYSPAVKNTLFEKLYMKILSVVGFALSVSIYILFFIIYSRNWLGCRRGGSRLGYFCLLHNISHITIGSLY
ncbi:MAG: hypothetical protein GF329_06980 [Candidatus Lokiarchaeota archaeon]|nr:hypothetical protein [Candidatus Lokiarchaeota archaeon]